MCSGSLTRWQLGKNTSTRVFLHLQLSFPTFFCVTQKSIKEMFLQGSCFHPCSIVCVVIVPSWCWCDKHAAVGVCTVHKCFFPCFDPVPMAIQQAAFWRVFTWLWPRKTCLTVINFQWEPSHYRLMVIDFSLCLHFLFLNLIFIFLFLFFFSSTCLLPYFGGLATCSHLWTESGAPAPPVWDQNLTFTSSTETGSTFLCFYSCPHF